MAGETRAPLVLGISIVSIILGSIFILLRVFTRTFIKRSLFGWDDICIIIAWIFNLAYTIGSWVAVAHGYGHHASDLLPSQLEQTIKAEIISQFLCVASFPPGKASVAILTAKVFPGRKLHLLTFAVVLNAIAFYLDGILLFAQCTPVWKQWATTYTGGSCWNPIAFAKFTYFVGSVGCVSDFFFVGVAWLYIPRLHMNWQKKLALGCALGAGVFAGCCSVVKVTSTSGLSSRTDYGWDTIPLVLLSISELSLINIAACIPTLLPFYRFVACKDEFSRATRTEGCGSVIEHVPAAYGGRILTKTAARATTKRKVPVGESILVETTVSVRCEVSPRGTTNAV